MIQKKQERHNLKNYEETYRSFRWEDAMPYFSFYETKKVNIAYEAIDRHAKEGKKNQIALFYHGDKRKETYTFEEIRERSNQAGNLLRKFASVKKGDHVFIFMPRIPELYFCLLGAIKIGAIVGPIFEAFMEGAVVERLKDGQAKVLITTPELIKRIRLSKFNHLEKIIIVGENIESDKRFIDYNQLVETCSTELEIEWVDLEDPFLIHYISDAMGKPKGIIHSHKMILQNYMTALWVLDLKENDIYWCTADPGWIIGTAYSIFAPWLHGMTNVVVGGRFSPEKWYRVLEQYGVTVWYSAPTAFRMLMGAGDDFSKKYDLTQLRHVVSVGERLNPEIVQWGLKVLNQWIHDTWLMTETGAQMICNFLSVESRPGSMGKPVPGIEVAILDQDGQVLPPNQMGNLAVKKGWPAMMKAIWNQKERYESYFTKDGWFLSGDSAYMDKDGYIYFQGRMDDMIKTSGERIGPFEVESKLLEHPAVREAGVIGKPDPVQGEVIKAFIALKEGYKPTETLSKEIALFIKNELSHHATPREIEFTNDLPKTKSGKIIRRVLKAIELE